MNKSEYFGPPKNPDKVTVGDLGKVLAEVISEELKLDDWREKEKANLGITDEQLDALIELERRSAILRLPSAYLAIRELIYQEKHRTLVELFGLDAAATEANDDAADDA